jgi:hypothetical protein
MTAGDLVLRCSSNQALKQIRVNCRELVILRDLTDERRIACIYPIMCLKIRLSNNVSLRLVAGKVKANYILNAVTRSCRFVVWP